MSEVGELVDGRYRILSRLGEGGQAVVYRVHDTKLRVDRALKRMLPAIAQKKKLRARFEAEARALTSLHHANLVRVYDLVTDGAEPYFVMEYVAGGALVDRLDHGALPPRLAIATALQICAGLAHAHQHGIIHRDVKPHNVLVGDDGTCKLMDFGIARMGEEGLRTRAGVTMGTEGFMSPEQAADAASVDVRADVYGAGMTLFVMLSARDPWDWIKGKGQSRVPPALVPVITRATEDHAQDRYPTIDAFAAAVRACLDGLPPDPPGTTLVPTRPPAPEPLDRAPTPAPVDRAPTPPPLERPGPPPPGPSSVTRVRRAVVAASIGGRPGEVDHHTVETSSRGLWLALGTLVVVGVLVGAWAWFRS